MTIEQIARVCHEANRIYCLSLNDYSQLDWDRLPFSLKQQTISGVKFHLTNPNASPEESHANWYNDKIKEGWTFGVEKDIEKKTHPCLRPYDELPYEQRMKDYLFKAIVDTLRDLID